MHTEICNYILISQIYPGRHDVGFYLQNFLTNINDFKEKNTSEITSSIYSKHEFSFYTFHYGNQERSKMNAQKLCRDSKEVIY